MIDKRAADFCLNSPIKNFNVHRTKGSVAWILDLGEENGLWFLIVFVGQAKILRANSM
jgi:hypothetical protein